MVIKCLLLLICRRWCGLYWTVSILPRQEERASRTARSEALPGPLFASIRSQVTANTILRLAQSAARHDPRPSFRGLPCGLAPCLTTTLMEPVVPIHSRTMLVLGLAGHGEFDQSYDNHNYHGIGKAGRTSLGFFQP